MVSKCANPGCSAPFLYLRQGKLFCIETSSVTRDSAPGFGADATVEHRSRRLEFFWLCEDCAPLMTLRYTPGLGVKLLQREPQQAAAAVGAL